MACKVGRLCAICTHAWAAAACSVSGAVLAWGGFGEYILVMHEPGGHLGAGAPAEKYAAEPIKGVQFHHRESFASHEIDNGPTALGLVNGLSVQSIFIPIARQISEAKMETRAGHERAGPAGSPTEFRQFAAGLARPASPELTDVWVDVDHLITQGQTSVPYFTDHMLRDLRGLIWRGVGLYGVFAS